MRDRWLGGVLAVHVVVRVGLWLAGVPVSTLPLVGYWQVADLQLLRDQPLETLWHLHAQPPLWNAFVAAVQQLPPTLHHPAYRAALAAAGVAVVGVVFLLARRLGVRPAVAAPVALAVSLSPTLLGYELFAFYSLPVAALVAGVVLAADAFERTPAPAAVWAAVGLAATVALTRSLFHLGWVALVAVALLAWRWQRPSPHLVAAALVPVLAVGLWYGRVAALTGHFTSSTWLGQSLHKVTAAHLDPDELAALVAAGEVAPIALVPPFQAPYHYDSYVELPAPTGVAVLDRVATSHGVRNLHNLGVVPVGEAYATAARQVLDARPDVVGTQLGRGLCFFLRPAHASTQVEAAYGALDGWRATWDRWVLLQARPDTSRRCEPTTWEAQGLASTSPIAALLVLAPIALGLAALARRLRGRHRVGDLALVVAGGTVGYVTVLTTLVEVGENYRFRFLVEPLGWVALALLAERVVRAVARRRPDAAPERA